KRLSDPVTHRRTVLFDKADKYWVIEDDFTGRGEHLFSFAFHLAPGVTIAPVDERAIRLMAAGSATSLLIRRHGPPADPRIEPAYFSRSSGKRERSAILKWEFRATVRLTTQIFIFPELNDEKLSDRLELSRALTDNIT